MSIPTGPLYLPYYGFPWPVPGQQSGSEAESADDFEREWLHKKGHLRYGSPYEIVSVDAAAQKVRIRVGRAESGWLTLDELKANSKEVK